MKKTIHTLVFAMLSLLTSSAASAQVLPNGDFEDWSVRNSSEGPVSWLTSDNLMEDVGLPPLLTGAVKKTDDKHNGSYAAKLENMPFIGSVVMPGIMAIGTLPDVATDALGGIPYTSRPAHLRFYYKQTGTNIADDSASVVVALTRYVNGQREIIAGADSLLRLAPSTYTLMSIPLNYISTATPDSVFLIFNSATAEEPTVGNALYLDDIALTGTITATRDARLSAALQVYPNPSASGQFTLTTQGSDTDLAKAIITVTDIQGSTVLRQTATRAGQPRTLDLQSQPAGFYILRLDTPKGFVIQRLVKS